MPPLSFARICLVATSLLGGPWLQAQDPLPVYRDPAQPREMRIRDLVSRMTLEEKAGMLSNATPGVPRLGIPKYDWWNEALHGVARAGHATVFPQAIGLAAMWDEELQHAIAHVIGVEGRAKFNSYRGTPVEGATYHGLTFWSPNINIFRDPRWGRGQETYGEDPFLTARLGLAFVRGLQGDHPDYLLAAACAKHFAVHSGPESLRHSFDVSPADADLYDTYLPAFETLVREGRAEIVMTAYNAIHGTPGPVHPLLYGLLDTWGFDGHVTSDCGSLADLIHAYGRAANDAEAEAMALLAGMNLCCGTEGAAAAEAVRRGLIAEEAVDRQLGELLRTLFRLGLFDPADRVPFNRIPPSDCDTPAHGALALRAARASLVLLKNDGVLPLDPTRLKRVAVIGPNADSVPVLLGNYNGEPSAPVTVLAGLKAALEPAGVQVVYAHGCDYAESTVAERPIADAWYRGDYFANASLSGRPTVTQWDRPIRLGSSHSYPALPRGLPDRDISICWTGDVTTSLAGDYEFVVRGRGGFKLLLDNETILDAWSPSADGRAVERSIGVTRRLGGYAKHAFTLEYTQGEGAVSVSLGWITPRPDAGVPEALAAAKDADAIIFVGGISAQLEGEEMEVPFEGFSGGDRTRIELPAVQRELLQKLRSTGKPVVFVNMSGSAIAMPWSDENVSAILQAWYPGQAGGTAVADVLLGNTNPAGRLPVTFYRATEDLPDFQNYDMANRTYRYFQGRPLYPFGHGLSYTTFRYGELQVTPAPNAALSVTLDVANTGDRDGEEVVQIYAVPPASRERQALCAFSHVHLASGETKTVRLIVPATALRRWSTTQKQYEIPSGTWTLRAGASSADIRQTATTNL